ncbi:MAG: repair protein RecN [Bacteroidota bacterium]|jgi:DNA repair protein RecN (Recombination protein N)
MITSLSIENYALIDRLSVPFSDGFSVITGETGAGKSILLGALGLVLGNRADLSSLKNKEEKCVIEAHFDLSKHKLQPFFDEMDWDFDVHTILRREILPSGKSRAFVNDTPVNVSDLQELGMRLIDIHSQNETQALHQDEFQFQLLDAVAQTDAQLTTYVDLLKKYRKAQTECTQLKQELANTLKEQDYNAFLLDELLAANLQSVDQEALESELEKLSNVEQIQVQIARALQIVQSEQFGLTVQLKEAKSALQKIAAFSNDYALLFERVSSLLIEMDDVENELERAGDQLQADPELLEKVSQQLQLLYALQKKHQVASVQELLDIQQSLNAKVLSLTSLESEIATLESWLQTSEASLNALAQELHQQRLQAIPIFASKIESIIADLGMPNARFTIELHSQDQFLANGKDKIAFLFAANKGTDFGLLKKVASGGEMSRIMLAVKALMAEYMQLPTLILDEIDTGVSGEIAHKMGEIMKAMSQNRQIFAITHLPQIAGKGKLHFKVYKTIEGETTTTQLKVLSPEERIQEIAQMLSGNTITEAAMGQAQALLN